MTDFLRSLNALHVEYKVEIDDTCNHSYVRYNVYSVVRDIYLKIK